MSLTIPIAFPILRGGLSLLIRNSFFSPISPPTHPVPSKEPTKSLSVGYRGANDTMYGRPASIVPYSYLLSMGSRNRHRQEGKGGKDTGTHDDDGEYVLS